ncbi:MAG: tRNA (adenosine(37)-N6)-threonylcarbamoyltransferase complex ATPase subunit type 1 TsaE [Chlorobi bacterium]|nr:tRNA (adenosine(37)-N6)-threonylcarbamoyltransferase complex ATPase subunit type 1 TsaE [Chlorobiota bacterium]
MEPELYSSSSEDETQSIGTRFASRLHRGDIVTLSGELGVGKTEFVRGVCSYFDVKDIVTSPTFSIINVYEGTYPDGNPIRIVHIDLYRLKSKHELSTIGLSEWLMLPDAIKLLEWPEKANGVLRRNYYAVTIRALPDDRRIIQITYDIPHTAQVVS